MVNNLIIRSNGTQYQRISNNGDDNIKQMDYDMVYDSNKNNMKIDLNVNNNGMRQHKYLHLNKDDIKNIFNKSRASSKKIDNILKEMLPKEKTYESANKITNKTMLKSKRSINKKKKSKLTRKKIKRKMNKKEIKKNKKHTKKLKKKISKLKKK
jgi:hypothetical protein